MERKLRMWTAMKRRFYPLGYHPRAGLVSIIPIIINKRKNLLCVELRCECTMRLVPYTHCKACMKQKVREPLWESNSHAAIQYEVALDLGCT